MDEDTFNSVLADSVIKSYIRARVYSLRNAAGVRSLHALHHVTCRHCHNWN